MIRIWNAIISIAAIALLLLLIGIMYILYMFKPDDEKECHYDTIF